MTMPTQVAPNDVDPKMPVPFDDEYGECTWYIAGHLTDQAAIVAVALWLDSEGLHDRDETYGCVSDATVERLYFCDDPADEHGDRMMQCGADDPGAQPFMRITGAG